MKALKKPPLGKAARAPERVSGAGSAARRQAGRLRDPRALVQGALLRNLLRPLLRVLRALGGGRAAAAGGALLAAVLGGWLLRRRRS